MPCFRKAQHDAGGKEHHYSRFKRNGNSGPFAYANTSLTDRGQRQERTFGDRVSGAANGGA